MFHLLSLLLDDEQIRWLLVECSADVDECQAIAAQALDLQRARPWYAFWRIGYAPQLQQVVSQSIYRQFHASTHLETRSLLLGELVDSRVLGLFGRRLRQSGVDPLSLKRFAVHGRIEPSPLGTLGSGSCSIILHNDPFTLRTFVCDVLTGVFQLPPADVERCVAEAEHRGRCSLGVYPPDKAYDLASTARTLAARQGFPLEISIVPQ